MTDLMTITPWLQAAEGQKSPQEGFLSSIVLMVGVLVILYFFMIRPQAQRQKKEKQFRQNLAKGSKVVTIGGLHGKIVDMDDTSVLLQVDEGVRMRFERSAVARYVSNDDEKKS